MFARLIEEVRGGRLDTGQKMGGGRAQIGPECRDVDWGSMQKMDRYAPMSCLVCAVFSYCKG